MKLANNKPAVAGLLLSVAAMWGGAFILMKDSLHRQDVNSFLACRFAIATLVLILLKPSVLRKIDRAFLIKGVTIGILLGTGYIFQSFGLTMITVAKTGFITGLYAVFVPLIAAGLFKRRVTNFQWFAVVCAGAGLFVLSFKGFSFGTGELLVLISALLFAFHIVSLGEWSSSLDTYALTVVQLGTSAVITGLASLKSGFHLPPDVSGWRSVILTAVFATAFAFIIQTWTQSFIPATTIAVILTMEYIFAAVFAVIFSHEVLTTRTLIGGTLLIFAMYAIIWATGREKIPA
ncbi:MAG: DMT family transporter [Actinomycetes bacterium]